MAINAFIVAKTSLSACPISSERDNPHARPFVKWVGGKGQLVNTIDSFLPQELKDGRISTYVEPFVGGGALFFHAAQHYDVSRFVLADNNLDLILTYWTIRERVGTLITVLHDIQNKHIRLSEQKREEHYYSVRDSFNASRFIDPSRYCESWIERAAQLIFLNKTGFNGLFRVNSSGMYNVAFGRYENPKINDPENLIEVSRLLKKAEILLGDFCDVLPYTPDNAFVYLDPPYRPLTETANFTAYSSASFTNLDQQRLANFCQILNSRGTKLMISNSDPSNVDANDRYFVENYPGFRIEQTEANRMVNCKADRRGKIRELLIMNY